MTMNKFITITMFGFALTLAGCDKGGDKGKGGDKQVAKQGKEGDKKTPEVKQPEEPAEPATPAPTLDPKVEQAVNVANQIAANPGDADTILATAGLDRESFEKLLYEIARDPELSKSYAVAREA